MIKTKGPIQTIKCILLKSSILLTVLLAACGGKGVIVTQDNSADYQNVKSLPPLKKPDVEVAADVSSPPIEQQAIDASAQDDSVVSVETSSAKLAIDYRVIEEAPKHAWLEIEAGFDDAWDFLSDRLGASDLTVHHRNQDASLIAIGCNDGRDNTKSDAATAKKSRWSIFKKKQSPLDYCALRLSKDKNKTKVMVFDRSGQEFDSTSAREVFARLLKS